MYIIEVYGMRKNIAVQAHSFELGSGNDALIFKDKSNNIIGFYNRNNVVKCF